MEETKNMKWKNTSNQHRVAGSEPAVVPVEDMNSPAWRNIIHKILGVASGIALSALLNTPIAKAQLGSPAFANPNEIRYRDGEKRLRGVIELVSGNYDIPNVGNAKPLRQFRGWDPANPPPAPTNKVGPGPTLRARIGDRVQISFFNKVDDTKFPYTFVTASKPGLSSFGCDSSSVSGANWYPAKDNFPNCFHGSSTANLHYHGTHTSPDGVGDNVLVEVLPEVKQPDWTRTFNQIFNSATIPATWKAMPPDFQTGQQNLITAHDTLAAQQAAKNGLPPPEKLWPANKAAIDSGHWPQYMMGAFPNDFELPDYASGKYKAGQAPGTHWYHAHKHGSTSLHMLNGLAGAFVIESIAPDGYDQHIRAFYKWGNTYGEHEKILVFQQLDPDQNLERNARSPRSGSPQVFVNGLLTPTITMRPGEVQLWRFVNATAGSVGGGNNGSGIICQDLFQTANFTVKQTAADGVQFSPGNYNNQPFLTGKVPSAAKCKGTNGLTLFAGNRADVLVQAPSATGTSAFTSNGNTRFFVKVEGAPVTQNPAFPPDWPKMPTYLEDLPKPGPNDATNPNSPVKFQWEATRAGPGRTPPPAPPAPGTPPHFMINGKQFGEMGAIVDQCMPLNGLQDWVLENHTNIVHPFHIHINPFQVIRIDTPTGQGTYTSYTPADNWVWQDVIGIPPAVVSGNIVTPGKITIRQTYLDFIGTYVLHCHILAHEDRGMMQLVRVVPAAAYPKGCQDAVPHHH